MSEHDDTLLDEDLGDEEYDLGNDEEEALLADDYEIERQNSYKGEEETDDILDLGVTDALDDLDAEDENIEFSRSKTDKSNDNDFYEDGEHSQVRSNYYEQDENNEQARQYGDRSGTDSVSGNIGKGDLREKLQKNMQKSYVGNGQGLEDDDCEDARERRNRFQNERTIVSPKMNNNIPDTLENVVTSEPSRPPFRGWGRGRMSRGAIRGGRFNSQNLGNFNPRFSGVRNQQPYDNQQPLCRPPLLDPRPPFFLGVPNNVQNQQIHCQQGNPQVQPFQHYSPNGPLQGPPNFIDGRGQFGPNQFQGVGPRQLLGPRPDYGPRPPLVPVSMPSHAQGQPPIPGQPHSQTPPYPCPVSNQSAYNHGPPAPPFPNSGGGHMSDAPPRFAQTTSGPLLQGNPPPGSLLGNPNALPSAAGPGPGPGSLMPGSQAMPMQGFPRQQPGPPISHPNVPMGNQPPYENRPPFQEPQFEGRAVFESRPGYPDQVPLGGQFNNNAPGSQAPPNMPNVPLPSGHKILINPRFRGAVQPTNDARLAWDSTQQTGGPGTPFPQSLAPFQNQAGYNQGQQVSATYHQNYQQSKSDDPYMYFSDVWQENKPQKSQGSSPSKQYSEKDSSYARETSYDCGSKYKSDNQWDQKDNYQEDHRGSHQSYRDRELPPKPRGDHVGKGRPLPSSSYRDEYDQTHIQKSPSTRSLNPPRGPPRLPQKRPPEPSPRALRDLSPKRIKPSNRNLQEVRTVDTVMEPTEEKKEEDTDPEMQEYRRKMEEQKRLREKILREKENRRKLAAMEKQNEETKTEAVSEGGQETKPVSVLMGVVKEAVTNKNHPGVGRGRPRPVSAQTTEGTERSSGLRIVRTIQSLQPSDMDSVRKVKDPSGMESETSEQMSLTPNSNTRRVVIQKSLPNAQKVPTTLQKAVTNLQKSQGQLSQRGVATGQSQTSGLKKGLTTQRIVTQKVAPSALSKSVINVQEVTNTNTQKVIVNTQNNQRVVLQKGVAQLKKLPDIKTNTVKLENLAASTSEGKIRSMCQGIGTIESIQMGERSATIVFKTQSAAMVFHKKYQRKMVDLSLITVRLVPQTNGTKTPSNLVKVS